MKSYAAMFMRFVKVMALALLQETHFAIMKEDVNVEKVVHQVQVREIMVEFQDIIEIQLNSY